MGYRNLTSEMEKISCLALEAGCHLLEKTPSRRIMIVNLNVNPSCLNLSSRSVAAMKPLGFSRVIHEEKY